MAKLVIHTDGGARGNPGPAAIGAVVGGKEYAEAIGETTNNIAEYKAVIFALKKARHLTGREDSKETEIEINSDSELIVNQLNGKYKIKEDDLKILFVDVWNIQQSFKKVTFNRIPREENKAADKLVNKLLGRQTLPF
ncbi:hypothetical protein CL629_00230 [bacterium]|nr:hypothetical protein [bacterium]|tara:strand:- start:2323 stop:2736 length:414 start_codon:yes stop_codon:yes gene_type:complete